MTLHSFSINDDNSDIFSSNGEHKSAAPLQKLMSSLDFFPKSDFHPTVCFFGWTRLFSSSHLLNFPVTARCPWKRVTPEDVVSPKKIRFCPLISRIIFTVEKFWFRLWHSYISQEAKLVLLFNNYFWQATFSFSFRLGGVDGCSQLVFYFEQEN